MRGGASEWHSFQSMRVCKCDTPVARPIKANYLKIVSIRPLYLDPMPLTSYVVVIIIIGHTL